MNLLDNELLQVLDSTKITCFMKCPRMFFFNYIWGIRPEEVNIHLHFGSAWHEAMKVLYKENNFASATIAKAYNTFTAYYSKEIPEGKWDSHFPKNPETALLALAMYAQQYCFDDFDVKVVEKCGPVHISTDPEKVLYAKCDVICEDEQGLFILEHKTSGLRTENWINQFRQNFQVGTYYHALCMFAEAETIKGVTVNGAFFRKKSKETVDFYRLEQSWTTRRLAAWLKHANTKYDQIMENYNKLSEDSESNLIMESFETRETSCIGPYGYPCEFLDLCMARQNPLQRLDVLPAGYKVEHWDPRKFEED